MGIVYRARHQKLGTACAVKILIAGENASPTSIARLQREAAAVSRMGKHPNIVVVYDLGQEGALFYYAMELIEGKDLAHLLAERTFTFEEAAGLVTRLAKALHYAHDHQIIHRDLKPANVLMRTDGEPQVIDFGIARDMSSDASLSVTGSAIGSPNFMAPEQARGQHDQCDARTDVYGLGGILYHVLTGVPPHPGHDGHEVLADIRAGKEIILPRGFRSNLPRDLETICLKCLEADQGRRYATAEELAEDLARFQRGEPVVARPVSWAERARRRAVRHWRVVVPSAAAVSVAVAFGLYAIVSHFGHVRDLTAEQGRTQAALHRTQEALGVAETARSAAQTAESRERDQKRKFFAEAEVLRADADDVAGHKMSALMHSIAAMRLGSTVGRANACWHYRADLPTLRWCSPNSPDRGRVNCLAFSPNGSRIASGSNDYTIRLWDSTTGMELGCLRGHVDEVNSVAFSPDGSQIVSASSDDTVRIWNANTRQEVRRLLGHTSAVKAVAVSPDGATIASGAGDHTVRLWETKSGKELATIDVHDGSLYGTMAFSPDGSQVAAGSVDFESDDQTVRVWGAASGAEVARFRGHKGDQGPLAAVAFSPDGRRLASGDIVEDYVWDVLSGKEVTLSKDPRAGSATLAFSVAFTPDGKRVISGDADSVQSWDATSGELLSSWIQAGFSIKSWAFSLDGYYAVSSDDDGAVRLWDLRPKPVLAFCSVGAFSPDGTRAAVTAHQAGRHIDEMPGRVSRRLRDALRDGVPKSLEDERIVDTSSGREVGRLEGSSDCGAFTYNPDGTHIAGVSGSDQEVHIWDAASGREVGRLRGNTGSVCSVAFSPDGTRFAAGSSEHTVRLWDVASGKEESCWTADGLGSWVAFSPDGTQIGCLYRTSEEPEWGKDPVDPILAVTWQVGTGARAQGPDAAKTRACVEGWLAPQFPSESEGEGILEGEGEWRTAWRDQAKDENGLPRRVALIFDRWEREIGMRVNLESGEVEVVAAPGTAYADDPKIAPLCK